MKKRMVSLKDESVGEEAAGISLFDGSGEVEARRGRASAVDVEGGRVDRDALGGAVLDSVEVGQDESRGPDLSASGTSEEGDVDDVGVKQSPAVAESVAGKVDGSDEGGVLEHVGLGKGERKEGGGA